MQNCYNNLRSGPIKFELIDLKIDPANDGKYEKAKRTTTSLATFPRKKKTIYLSISFETWNWDRSYHKYLNLWINPPSLFPLPLHPAPHWFSKLQCWRGRSTTPLTVSLHSVLRCVPTSQLSSLSLCKLPATQISLSLPSPTILRPPAFHP